MRTWVKMTGLAAIGLLATSAFAADHGDPLANSGGTGSDIADVYSWVKDDNDTVVLIQTIAANAWADNVYYTFHVGRSADAASAITAPSSDVTDIVCWFDGGAATATTCYVGDTMVTGDASTELNDSANGIKVHAGSHDDPFYFHLQGFVDAQEFAVANAGLLQTNGDGCPTNMDTCIVAGTCGSGGGGGTGGAGGGGGANAFAGQTISSALLGMLNGTIDKDGAPTTATDALNAGNVMAIVMEVDKDLLTGTGDYIQVWASTHAKN